MVVIGGFEQAAKERLDAHDLEVMTAHFACPDGTGNASGFHSKIAWPIRSDSRKHRVASRAHRAFPDGIENHRRLSVQASSPVRDEADSMPAGSSRPGRQRRS